MDARRVAVRPTDPLRAWSWLSPTASGRAEQPHSWDFIYRPEVRQAAYQILLLVAVAFAATWVVTNVADNLRRQNIASGFAFLGHTAGFDVSQTLIEYSSTSTYARVFWVGLLNTLLVAGLGIVAATLIGFAVGIARLSTNWLIAKLATVYVETIRNVPLLLQLFFWYFAVLKNLPLPRESLVLPGGVYLNVRGAYLPAPVPQPGFGAVAIAFGIGVLMAIAIWLWARRRQMLTGKAFPVVRAALLAIVWLPLAVFLLAGSPLSLEHPELKGFNFQGGITVLPELIALLLGLSIYTASFIAEIVRAGIQGVPKGQTEAAQAIGLSRGQTLRLVVIPQAAAHHHPAAHQPVSQPHQELLAGGGDRLPRLRQRVHRHRAEPDRPGRGSDPADHGSLPVAEPAHGRIDELVQPPHGAGGEMR